MDLVFLLDGKVVEAEVKQPIRRMSQELWDTGIRLSPVTRKRAEVERYDADNVEFALAMLDHRLLAGDAAVYERLAGVGLPKMLERENKAIAAGLLELRANLAPYDRPRGIIYRQSGWLAAAEGFGRLAVAERFERAKRRWLAGGWLAAWQNSTVSAAGSA